MSKADARIILAGLLPDGLRVRDMTPTGKQELRDAIDRVLDLAGCRDDV